MSTYSDMIYLNQYQTSLDLAYYDTLAKSNELRVIEQKKQYDYFIGSKTVLESYLQVALEKTWKEYTVGKMPKSYTNVLRKIINALSVIYKSPPTRSIYLDGKKSDKMSKYLASILDPNLNKIDKLTHKLGKLHNTSVPFLKFENGKFTQTVQSSWYYNVYSNYENHFDMDKITYSQYFPNVNNEPELFTVVWTANEFYIVASNGDRFPYPGNSTMENIYGVIPVPVLRFNDENDFWGEGMNLATNENEEINVLMTKLNYDDIILGTAGILFGLNLGKLSSKNDSNDDSIIPGGRDAILKVEQKMGDIRTADLKFVSTKPQVSAVIKAIDWKIKLLAMEHGLNPSNFAITSKAESGFSRLVGTYEQIEVRQDDVDACREYELNRFNILRKMNNALVDGGYAGTEHLRYIPDNAELLVDFADIKPQLSGNELWNDRAQRENRNLASAIDWIMEDNPDIKTVEQAKEVLAKNKEFNNEFLTIQPSSDMRFGNTEPTASGLDIGHGLSNNL